MITRIGILIIFFMACFIINIAIMTDESKTFFPKQRKDRGARKQKIQSSLIFAMVVLGMGLFQSDLRADQMIWGEVKSVYAPGNMITIKKFVPQKNNFEEMAITVPRTVEFNELASLDELHPGDEVVVAGEPDEKTGKWVASLIDLRESYKAKG